jgi:hypothetical protein
MISFPQAIADAYVMPSRNVALPSTPGRQVRFLQGHAVIKDGRDLVAMMRRVGVLIVLTPYALGWRETFLKEAGEGVRAEVRWPESEPEPPPPVPPEPLPVSAVEWDPKHRADRPAVSS